MPRNSRETVDAKKAVDSIIKKSRVHFYKPIQIAEILHRNRTQRGRGGEECGKQERVMVTNEQRRNEIRNQDERRDWSDWYEVATKLCTLDDGLSNGLVRPRGWRNASLKAAGNAIVPQVAEQILRSIKHTN